MNRRDAIKKTSLILGTTISASMVAGVMNGCQAPLDPNWTPSFFTTDQIKTVSEIAERILPRTYTPGAKDAKVHRFIDILYKDCEASESQQKFLDGLSRLDQDAETVYGKPFVDLTDVQKDELLAAMDKGGSSTSDQGLASELANEGEDSVGVDLDDQEFFDTIRQLTLLGYFTSEIGAKEALVFDQIPGDYIGCIPYEKVGGSWAM